MGISPRPYIKAISLFRHTPVGGVGGRYISLAAADHLVLSYLLQARHAAEHRKDTGYRGREARHPGFSCAWKRLIISKFM